MSIASEITRINANISAAYDACEDKGAAIPQTRNSANLANTIANIASLSFEIVQTKPAQNIKTNVIYLIPKADAETDNVYDEWIYVNNGWELIGSTAIDLSDYYTAEEVDEAIFEAIPDIAEKMDLAINGRPRISDNKGQAFYTNDTIGFKTSVSQFSPTQTIEAYTTDYIDSLVGITANDVAGLQADFENKVFTRLAGAVGKTAGANFNTFPMYGGRKRCNVADDGTINAYYGDAGYTEDGTNGQVMVCQPAFWYKVVPLKLEKNTNGIGFHIRKANYYVSGVPKAGFKRHPLFYDENGNAVDYVLLSAYEGSMYDASEATYVDDYVDEISYAAGDMLCSVAGKRPISGKLTGMGSRTKLETMANNRGTGWHLDTYKSVAANQLLMMVEFGALNTQSAVGRGVVDNTGNVPNRPCLTGSTSSLGNATGMAASTVYDTGDTPHTTEGEVAVSYRGQENPWGNLFKHINGINLWGNGAMGAGQVYISDGFTYNDNSHSGNYKATGISVADRFNGWISAFGYGSEEYDWVMICSEANGASNLPVGDYIYASVDLNAYRAPRSGGDWNDGSNAGGFYLNCGNQSGYSNKDTGGRLLYVPTAIV